MQMIDEDRPLENAEQDEYGFAPIAEKLAVSIAGLAGSEGMVFGIEGAWGSGKTTFMNFLRVALKQDKKVNVLTLSPWLLGDSRSLVAALAEAIGPVLEAKEETGGKRFWANRGKKVVKSIDLMRSYAARTGRGMAPLAKLAGLFVPGAAAAGDLLEVGAGALEGLGGKQTDEAIKTEITKRILDSGAKFVVIMDDLDRLEPSQAVEVMRLIRSVADFPRIAYILCYDREVLTHALETGLSLKDGDLFLQKIVQLTFSLPLPEPFDLRTSLRRKCIDLYREFHRKASPTEEANDLRHAIDREGGGLRTPRDVKLVLNNLAFVYPTIADDIYYPDLCRIHLLKALRPKLHGWIERYLGARAALVSGDASIHKSDRVRMGDELQELLPDDDRQSTDSIWRLRSYVPGVIAAADGDKRVFQATTDRDVTEMIEARRLGSPLHHRFYFALSAPKAMIPAARMEEIRAVAGQDAGRLLAILSGYIEEERPLGQSWYEHLLARLDGGELAKYRFDQLAGLLMGLATTYTAAQRKLGAGQAMLVSLSDKLQFLADKILQIMRSLDAGRTSETLESFYRQGDLSWLVGHFHRRHLFNHGVVGEQPKPKEQWVLTEDELNAGTKILQERSDQSTDTLATIADFGSFIWGWRDLSGVETVKKWIADHAGDDRTFIFLLKELRSWAVSDRVYYPLRRDAVDAFFDYDAVAERLNDIHASGDAELRAGVEELRISLAQGAHPD